MQHRKVYIDDWCLMEKICLVSAVLRLGDTNWSSVSELIKPRLQENRPWDWFTPDACEAQYKILLNEYVQTQVKDESPALQIIQNLKTKCKAECQGKDEQRSKYMTLKKKIENLLKNGIENELLDKYYEEVQREKKEKEENLRRHQEALKRRETLKMEFEKTNVPRTPNKSETKADGGSSPIVTSPLLSSLLNNPPAVQYRPTLSTSSFIPTKSSQSISKSSSFDKLQSFSSDTTYKDSFSAELAEQLSSLDRQTVPVASTSSTVIKKSESEEMISTMPIATSTRTVVDDSGVSRIQTSIETTPKSDPQNLETLGLISPNEAEYLAEVDIPPEALLEVIGDLKEGTISIDKLIRDLEATDESVIIDKDLTTVSIPMDESYAVDNKPAVPASYTPEVTSQDQPVTEIKTEIIDESKIEVNEVEAQPSDLPSIERDKLDMEEQAIIIEDTNREDHEIRTTDTENIANIEINNMDIPVTKIESPSSVSSTVAISVEFDSSFSEQKSDTETVESQVVKFVSSKSSESEIEDDVKSKSSKSVVVIKRIEDGTGHSNKNKKYKNRISIEESIKEIENVTTDVDQIYNINESQPEHQIDLTVQQEIVEDQKTSQEPDTKMSVPVFDENVIIETDIDSKETVTMEVETETVERAEPLSIADDSDVSDKFEDALQTQPEEINETCVTENIISVETEVKSSPYVDVDESFVLNLSDEKPAENTVVEEKPQEIVVQPETSTIEQAPQVIVTETENLKSNEPEPVETVPSIEANENKDVTLDESKITEIVQETVEESKKSEDVKPQPTKIIKSSRRKRKSTSETNDGAAEMSIVIPSVALKEIETFDSDIEQTFTPVHQIKAEPSDSKPEDEKKERKEETSVAAKPMAKEVQPSASARIKSERRDTKTPERVVMVLRRSNNKTQSPLKKIDRDSRSADNSELVKTRKKSILLAHSRLTSHKYANAFQKPITNRQVAGYENVIYKPMDLQTIKKKIENKQISTVAEFQRDILLMLNNAKMYNRINSQVYNMAVEVEEEALLNIQLTVQNLGEGVLSKTQKTSEKIRKRQSLENTRKDLKLIKRIRYSTKDDSFTNLPIKKPKLEENEDE